MRGLTAILILPAFVTACSMQEIADINQKISDGVSGIMTYLRGNSNTSDNSMRPMTLAQLLKKNLNLKVIMVVSMLILLLESKDITSLCQVRSWTVCVTA
ncbi:Uncharacterised protein [Salmonella enterica subsp. enterica serovar Typhi]|nr:Uncharacterised protein [Salmonella enterica subsp. enterica serovar Typhi]CIM70849.1 Uncharacterised protein [Salmonella enterica subsp. enterica serovar Typhi]CIN38069.1 Uncharacterised protein [Salmonella enterica subsp. enterica serovar Typhi]CIN38771.1 Uncharacterised protein [Salmonella enterica subsp. enterica serovar Typhi]